MNSKTKAQLVLAHGAGAGSKSDFMQQICNKITDLSQGEIKVIMFDFPYMQIIEQTGKKRPPNKMPVLVEAFIEQVKQLDLNLPVFVGGKSMGARVALETILACEQQNIADIKGYFALGYPFHPVGKPDKLRLDLLNSVSTKGLIIQGERDTFGNKSEVERYNVRHNYQFKWILSGDHSLKPLKSSGLTQLQTITQAANWVVDFILSRPV
ncbi:hypothetical protein N7931_03105 [Catenovulum sp. 2E275]|uniref:alpha/beta family hydrolase n=1 Tax=Catenovulum sp. 2E275 TaxID=2980497 RepID=UPI0021D00393|nr:alpha/beta family hydrolase [Catenovulum sp. 2E275]MCU4674612.1 hypothetical protein [Catenovulum sp. 2E275]